MGSTMILLGAAKGGADDAGGALAALAGAGIFMMIIYFAVIAAIIVGMWKIFTKAGKPGWAAIVPIYNVIVLCEITGQPIWVAVLAIIPCTSFIGAILISLELAKRFGCGTGFALGLIFLSPIFIPILGFGSARYTPPPPQ